MAWAQARPTPPIKDTLLPHGRFLVGRAMRERGLSVTGLALRLAISRKHLSNVLGGKVPLAEDLADRIATQLNLAPEHLRVLRHDGVIPGRLKPAPPFAITIAGDPTEPIPGWFES
jgi:hypothetical protein